MVMVRTLKNILNSHWGGILRMWTFYVDCITQNNSYKQLLATLCMFLSLLYDLRQTSS